MPSNAANQIAYTNQISITNPLEQNHPTFYPIYPSISMNISKQSPQYQLFPFPNGKKITNDASSLLPASNLLIDISNLSKTKKWVRGI